MSRIRSTVRWIAAGVLAGIAIYAVAAGDWLRAVALVALLVLVSACASTPTGSQLPAPAAISPMPDACPPLPLPAGTSRAARDAHALAVIQLYGQCATSRNTP